MSSVISYPFTSPSAALARGIENTVIYGKEVDNYGILWLKSSKRKSSKDKMQGKGWEMVLPTRTQEENIDIFNTVRRLFDLENPTHAPIFTEFKTIVKREL
jgi:hypothetical protein